MDGIKAASLSAYTFSWSESLDEGACRGSGKRLSVPMSSSAGMIWQLCAASMGLVITDPRSQRELIDDAIWLAKDTRIAYGYPKERIEKAKQFSERLELAASNLAAGNIFGTVDVESFTALADAADWKLPSCFTRGESPPLVHGVDGDSEYDLTQVNMEICAEIERRRTEIAHKDSRIRDLEWEAKRLSEKNRRLENRLQGLQKKYQRVKKISGMRNKVWKP